MIRYILQAGVEKGQVFAIPNKIATFRRFGKSSLVSKKDFPALRTSTSSAFNHVFSEECIILKAYENFWDFKIPAAKIRKDPEISRQISSRFSSQYFWQDLGF